jgi:hypothetical protein
MTFLPSLLVVIFGQYLLVLLHDVGQNQGSSFVDAQGKSAKKVQRRISDHDIK